MPQLCIFRMNELYTKNVNNFHYKKKTDLNFLILDYKISSQIGCDILVNISTFSLLVPVFIQFFSLNGH